MCVCECVCGVCVCVCVCVCRGGAWGRWGVNVRPIKSEKRRNKPYYFIKYFLVFEFNALDSHAVSLAECCCRECHLQNATNYGPLRPSEQKLSQLYAGVFLSPQIPFLYCISQHPPSGAWIWGVYCISIVLGRSRTPQTYICP